MQDTWIEAYAAKNVNIALIIPLSNHTLYAYMYMYTGAKTNKVIFVVVLGKD